MKKRVKSYLVFTSLPYRIAMYLLIPAGLLAIGIWGGIHIGDMGLLLVAVLLPMAEIISDSWLFGGIQGKDMEKMDYLKTSARGMAVMRRALAVDLERKFLTAFGTIVVCYLVIGHFKDNLVAISGGRAELMDFIGREGVSREIGFLVYLVLLSYVISALGTYISRYFSSISGNMIIGYIASVLIIICTFGLGLRGYLMGGMLVLDLLFAAMGIGVSVLAVRGAMKKVEGGYYDERFENRL